MQVLDVGCNTSLLKYPQGKGEARHEALLREKSLFLTVTLPQVQLVDRTSQTKLFPVVQEPIPLATTKILNTSNPVLRFNMNCVGSGIPVSGPCPATHNSPPEERNPSAAERERVREVVLVTRK